MYKKLFEQGYIGRLKLKNRVVMTAMGVSLASSSGEANDDIIRYYEERAKGGCGLIITEVTRIDDVTGVGTSHQLSVTQAKNIPQLQRLVDTVHKYGTKIFFQLHHPGRQTSSALLDGRQIVAPSPIMCKMMQEMPRELTTKECENLRDAFVRGAIFSQMAGADGIELHAAHGYLLNEFLSPYTNQRTDQYGGSEENRLRFLHEIIAGIRSVCGPNFPICVRLSADEFVENGLGLEDTLKIASVLEAYGIDAIDISTGIYESMNTIVEPGSYAQGWKKKYAKAVKEQVSIPVIAVNNIKEPAFAESLLEENVCDFIGLGRALLADPDWVNKALSSQEEEIRKCIGCLYCFEGLGQGKHIACTVNARLGREREFDTYNKNGNQQVVAVVGGGPSGMEAARVLAERDFKVVLLEQKEQLGGTLNIADKPLLKEKITRFTDSMIAQLHQKNVEIRCGVENAIEEIKTLNPVGVFLAFGASPIIPRNLPGITKSNVLKAEDILTGEAKVKGRVAVIGSGMTGCETAEYLAEAGCNVTLVEMQPQLGTGIYPPVLMDLMGRFQTYAPEILVNHRLEEITETGIRLTETTSNTSIEKSVDYIVLALGFSPNKEITDTYESTFTNVHTIGDAAKAGKILHAVADGFGQAYVFEA
ncbi:MAG: NAD(P)/FAD-dependent oxidoreductase [Mobilitalea sp.]